MKNTIIKDKHGNAWFFCKGCNFRHRIPVEGDNKWEWNGDLIKPTFSPSILVTWNELTGDKVCHSFVKEGRIQYLGDCTHKLAGQTVDLIAIK